MSKISEDILLIDGLEYCNWNRELFENAHQAGLNAIHATLVYWENTEESFEKINDWQRLFKDHHDIIAHAKTTEDILQKLVKKNGFIGLSLYPYHLKNLGDCTLSLIHI